MKQKLKNNKGMTLMEMLCTVVIVVLMSALLVTGMALAANTLSSSVTASEARVLCDTLTTRLCYFIERDGYNDDRVTVLDSKGESTEIGEFYWRGNKMLPSKTYPTSAGAKLTYVGEIEVQGGEGENTYNVTVYQLKLGVYNLKTGAEYCHNIIQIQGNHAVVDSDTSSTPSPTDDSQSNPLIDE